MTAERDVENAFVTEGAMRGALAYKLVSPGRSGVPDRVVFFPGGATALVELKATGKSPRPLQRVIFQRLGRLGHPVSVVDSVESARGWWDSHWPQDADGGGR